VAFTAQALPAADVSVYTGAGGPLRTRGAPARAPVGAHTPVINNEGFVLSDCGTPPLFMARAGVLTVRLAGTEHPIFARLASSYSLNTAAYRRSSRRRAILDRGRLFTGNDPLNSKVVRTGDVVFGSLSTTSGWAPRHQRRGQIAFSSRSATGQCDQPCHPGHASTDSSDIDFATQPSRTFGDPPFVVIAAASSGLPVSSPPRARARSPQPR